MKTVSQEQSTLDDCVNDARREQVVVTRDGVPVAVVIGLDEEQVELGSSDEFWKLISERRGQRTISRATLEQELARLDAIE